MARHGTQAFHAMILEWNAPWGMPSSGKIPVCLWVGVRERVITDIDLRHPVRFLDDRDLVSEGNPTSPVGVTLAIPRHSQDVAHFDARLRMDKAWFFELLVGPCIKQPKGMLDPHPSTVVHSKILTLLLVVPQNSTEVE